MDLKKKIETVKSEIDMYSRILSDERVKESREKIEYEYLDKKRELELLSEMTQEEFDSFFVDCGISGYCKPVADEVQQFDDKRILFNEFVEPIMQYRFTVELPDEYNIKPIDVCSVYNDNSSVSIVCRDNIKKPLLSLSKLKGKKTENNMVVNVYDATLALVYKCVYSNIEIVDLFDNGFTYKDGNIHEFTVKFLYKELSYESAD